MFTPQYFIEPHRTLQVNKGHPLISHHTTIDHVVKDNVMLLQIVNDPDEVRCHSLQSSFVTWWTWYAIDMRRIIYMTCKRY